MYSKSSNLKQFFDKPRIQLLLINNYDNIRGYLDFNIEDGLCVLKSASPSQNNINIFNSNWRDQVNQLTINDIRYKLDFVNSLLNEFLDSMLKVDMVLDENILSKHEYEKALKGKRHFRDF